MRAHEFHKVSQGIRLLVLAKGRERGRGELERGRRGKGTGLFTRLRGIVNHSDVLLSDTRQVLEVGWSFCCVGWGWQRRGQTMVRNQGRAFTDDSLRVSPQSGMF
jgi:hypothetical protein